MTDQSNAKPIEPSSIRHTGDASAVNKELVAKYLQAHPSFLTDNPDLLVQIQVHLQENGVVSLTQIQAAQSREKIKQLKSQLEELVGNARYNEMIYKTYADLNIDLALAKNFTELEACLHKHLVGTLGLESVSIVLLNEPFNQQTPMSEIQQRSLFDKKLAREPFYFGRVGNVDKEALFPQATAASVALVLLNEITDTHNAPLKSAAIGLLAIASKDPLHFQPNMDTVLVNYLRKNLNIHINRLR